MSRRTKIIIAAITSILLVVAVIVFYTFDPENISIFPKCPFLLATGYECPGCGTQRAIHHFLHFRFYEAVKHNAFILFAIPYIILGFYLEYWGGKNNFPKLERVFFGKYSTIIVFVGIFVYWILRNIF